LPHKLQTAVRITNNKQLYVRLNLETSFTGKDLLFTPSSFRQLRKTPLLAMVVNTSALDRCKAVGSEGINSVAFTGSTIDSSGDQFTFVVAPGLEIPNSLAVTPFGLWQAGYSTTSLLTVLWLL